MKRTKRNRLSLGSISEGTLRMEDLIPAVLDALEPLRLTRAHRNVVRHIRNLSEEESYFESEEQTPDDDYMELCGIADCYVPDYCYFGSLEGDGACVGVWPVQDLFISDNRHGGYDGYIGHTRDQRTYPFALEVNDHGNATLYRRAGNRWMEVWSVV